MSYCTDLQNILHNEIPLSKIMGINVTRCDNQCVALNAPLEPNINHKCTAFGGSLYSVAVLCGWSFVFNQMQLKQLHGHIVIQHSEVDYKLPVDGEIQAICSIDDTNLIDRFIKTYQRKRRARITLQVKVIFNNQDALIFTGRYVVHQ